MTRTVTDEAFIRFNKLSRKDTVTERNFTGLFRALFRESRIESIRRDDLHVFMIWRMLR